LHAGGLGFESL